MTSLDDVDGEDQERWTATLASRATSGLQTSSHEALVVAARSGGGLACLARFRADPDPALTRLETPTPPPAVEVCILVHRDSRATPRIRATSAVIAEAVSAFLPD